MKRIIFLILIFLFLCSPAADAELGSWGLIVEDGSEEIIMEKGAKDWLLIRDGLTGLPKFKGLTFFSDNTIVARVGLHTGILTAESYGTANISVTDEAGENGIVTVKVVATEKQPFSLLFLLLFLFAALCGLLLWAQK